MTKLRQGLVAVAGLVVAGLVVAACGSATTTSAGSTGSGATTTSTSSASGSTGASGTSGSSGSGAATSTSTSTSTSVAVGSSPTTIPSGAPGACPASALRVELYSFPYDPLKWATEVVLTNTSSSSCSLIGYPSLSATFADGQAFQPSPVGRWRAGSVTDPDHPSGRFHHPHLVVLTPGHKALFFSVTGTDGCTGAFWQGATVAFGLPEGGSIRVSPVVFPACQDEPLGVTPIQHDAGGLPAKDFEVPAHQLAAG